MTRSQSADFSAIHGLRQRDAKVKEIFFNCDTEIICNRSIYHVSKHLYGEFPKVVSLIAFGELHSGQFDEWSIDVVRFSTHSFMQAFLFNSFKRKSQLNR